MKKETRQPGPRSATAADQAIGRNIRQLRLFAGLSQQDVAATLGVTFQQVQKYENGSNRLPVATLLKLKTLYGVPYERFFAGTAPVIDGPEDRAGTMADYDDDTVRICRRVAAIGDRILKQKIGHIIDVLAS